MDPLREHGGRPGTEYDDAWWRAVHALFDEAFPGLPSGIARAAKVGVEWASWTTPFALFEGDRCVAHVGVLAHPIRVEGEVIEVAGIHAVCTTEDRRRRGLCRRLLRGALEWADARYPIAKLHTDDPPVYAGHGFAPTPTWRFLSAAEPAPSVRSRPLDLDDAADLRRLRDTLSSRAPVSDRFTTADDGWLVLTDAALANRLDRFVLLEDHDAIVAYGADDDGVLVHEVIAEALPPAAVIRGASPDPTRPMRWTFCPDRLDPDAIPEPAPAAIGTFMVRGGWPAPRPLGVSPLWEH